MTFFRSIFGIAIALMLLGAVSIALQPVVDPAPDTECVAEGQPSSGFQDGDKDDCNISQESFKKVIDHESKAKPLRIIGALLILGGIIVGIVGIVRRARSRRDDDAGPPAA